MAYEHFKTLTQLTTMATLKLRQAAGPGVNLYSDAPLKNAIEDVYNLAVGERWWPHLMQWFTRTLDGTTGIVTQDFDNVSSMADVRAIYREGDQEPLPYLSENVNPNTAAGLNYPSVEALSYNDTNKDRLFRLWPLTSTGTLYIHARTTPVNIFTDPEVVVPFDPQLLAVGAAWSYAASEGVNPAHVQKLQQEFQDSLKRVRSDFKNLPIIKDPNVGRSFDRWAELPYGY